MADVGEIVASIILDRKQWDKSISGVKQDTKTLGGIIDKNSAKIKSFGRAMTIAGIAIVGGFAAIVKKASDASETFSKFGVVFRDVLGDANKEVKNLTKNYGLSSIQASKLLGDTGDLLKGFGFTSEAALDLSTKVQRMAVDLASFTNIEGGAERASKALTTALLGEGEAAKALGIKVTQNSKEFNAAVKATVKMKGVTEAQAKVFVILGQAVSQSKDSVGDFSRTQDLLANQSRVLSARFQELIVDIGQKLIPVAQQVVKFFTEIIEEVSKWIKENPKLSDAIIKVTLAIGGLMAVLGPFLIVIATIPAKFRGIATAVGKATLLITLATIAYAKWSKLLSGDFAAASSKAATTMVANSRKQIGALRKMRAFMKVASEEEKKQMADKFKLLGESSKNVGRNAQLVLSMMWAQSNAYRKWAIAAKEAEKAVTKEQGTQVAKRKELTVAEFTAREEAAKKAKAKAKELADFRQGILEREVAARVASEQFFDEEMGAINEERTALAETGLQGVLARIQKDYEARKMAIMQNVIDEQQRAILLKQLETLTLEEIKAIRFKFNEDATANWIESWQKRLGFASQVINTISSLFRQASQNRIDQIEKEYQEQRDAIIANVADETEREKQLEALEDQFSAKKKEAARSAAKWDKASAMVGAIVNTAQAVTKALAVGGPIFGPIMAGIMGALGAVQIGLIASQPIPLATGGIVTEPTQALIGEAGPEAVIPLDQIEDFGGGGGMNVTFNINTLDSRGMVETVQQRIIPILQNATRDENFLISPNAVRAF